MFGFIEEKLAQILGMPYEPFLLNDGARAAIIERQYYVRTIRALCAYHSSRGDAVELTPIDKESDIVGMRVMLHKYYYDDRVLDGLTSGSVKETESYEAIKQDGTGTQRFNVLNFERDIKTLYDAEPIQVEDAPRPRRVVRQVLRPRPILFGDLATDGMTPVQEERLEETQMATEREDAEEEVEEPVKKVKVDYAQEIFNRFEGWGFHFTGIDEFEDLRGLKDNGFKIAMSNCSDAINRKMVFELANTIKRHIFIGDNARHLSTIKKYCNTKEFTKNFLIIITDPNNISSEFVRPVSQMQSISFGREIHNLYVVRGINVNTEIDKIRKENLPKDEQAKRIDAILKEGRNSPYAKYDRIYKDTATNVVFAVQDRYILYLMYLQSENAKFTATVFNELARRFDGTISYSELLKIDSDYQSVLEKENREEYAKFSIDSSISVIRQLKKAYEDAKKAYEDYLTKAMESGKMCSKYMEQIEAFNEADQQLKMKQRAYEEYDAVRAIPQIMSLYVQGEKVNIYTKNLYARDDRTKKLHDIGTFHISIGMHSNTYDTQNTVVIKNTKHQIVAFNGSTMQAPHVFPEGYICHGTLATGMANAYKKRDLYQLVYQLILFLSQANTDDAAGKHVNCWPEVDEAILMESEEKRQSKVAEIAEFIETPADKEFNEAFSAAIPV